MPSCVHAPFCYSVAIIFLLGGITQTHHATAQEQDSRGRTRFADSFEKQDRAGYVQADGMWQSGHWVLSAGERLVRDAPTGAQVQLRLSLHFASDASLAKENPEGQTELLLGGGKGAKTSLVWRIFRRGDLTLLALQVRGQDVDSKTRATRVIRTWNQVFRSELNGDWSVEFFDGSLLITTPQRDRLTACVAGHGEDIVRWELRQATGSLRVDSIVVAGAGRPELTEEQQQHLKDAQRLAARVQLYASVGRRQELYEALLERSRLLTLALGPEHPRTLRASLISARYFRALGRHTECAAAAQRVVEIARRVFGTEHFFYSQCLELHGFAQRHAGKAAETISLLEESLRIREKTLGSRHSSTISAQNDLAAIYQQRGQYDKAEPLLLSISESMPRNHPHFPITLINLGTLYSEMGDFPKAVKYLDEGLAITQSASGRRSNGYLNAVIFLANAHTRVGNYKVARQRYQEAEELVELLFGGRDHPLLARVLNNQAAVEYQTGNFASAIRLSTRSLELTEKLQGRGREYARGATNLGALFNKLGDYGKARPILLEAREILARLLGKTSPEYAENEIQLGELYSKTDKYGLAENVFTEALAAYETTLGRDHERYALVLTKLADVYAVQGNESLAEKKLLRAFEIVKQQHLASNSGGYCLARLCALYARQGRYQELEKYRPLLGGKGDDFLAQRYFVEKRYEQAAKLWQRLAETEIRRLRPLLMSLSEAQALNYLAQSQLNRDGFLSAAIEAKLSPADTYDLVWQGRRLLYRTIARRQQATLQLGELDGDARSLVDEYVNTRRQIASLTFASSSARQNTVQLNALNDRKEQLEIRLQSVAGKYVVGLEVPRTTLTEMTAQLGPDTVFVDIIKYWRTIRLDPKPVNTDGLAFVQHYLAFVITPGGEVFYQELGKADTIDELAKNWRQKIDQDLPADEVPQQLRRLVWDPLTEHFPPRTNSVYLCPDGALSTMPWCAMPDKDAKRILLEDYAIGFVPYGQFLLETKREVSSAEQILLLGAVAYGDSPDTDAAQVRWPGLPGTADEVERIAQLYGPSLRPKTLLGVEASSTNLLRALPGSRIAHLATHGFFAGVDSEFQKLNPALQTRERSAFASSRDGVAERNPLVQSGLVLAGANHVDETTLLQGESSYLTAEAIVGLDLRKLDLVVLSACETGLGDIADSEGTLGLQRAFHLAGTRNVVSSLWRVDDEATAALMRSFYHCLWVKKQTPLQALRTAQLTVYRNPAKIGQLARGPQFSKIVRIAPAKSGTANQPSARAPIRQWAAFFVSGGEARRQPQ